MRLVAMGNKRSGVGRPLPDVLSSAKVRGSLGFLQDLDLPGMLHAGLVFAGRPHAAIRAIAVGRALAVDGVVAVATADDVPGQNRLGLVIDDQPVFAVDRVRYEADCVAIVGAEDLESARLGALSVDVDFEDLPRVDSTGEARSSQAPLIHENGNLAVERKVVKGDVGEGESASSLIVERTFHSPVQEHVYLEPLGAIAVPQGDGSIEILVPGQCPFYVRDAVSRCLGLPMSAVRVFQLPLGGGFGGKEDVPSELCARLAVLAVKTGRPVRLVLTREEDMVYSSKRHPMELWYRMGCGDDGRITFADIAIDADVGAYATLSPIVLFRSTMHAAGPYEIPHVRILTRGYYSNTAPKGAMRGFGTPQVVFACEAVIDELAQRAGIDPIDFRLGNALKVGSSTATGQVLDESVGLPETLQKVKDAVGSDGWSTPRKVGDDVVAARGVAAMYYGVSLGAAGRILDRGGTRIEILKDGSVSVFVGCTDMGQGALTVLTQITADALGVGTERIRVNRVDTGIVPDSGPTVASRTTVICGNAILDACSKLRARLVDAASGVLGDGAVYDTGIGGVVSAETGREITFDQVVAECSARRIDLTATGWYAIPECRLDDETGQGKAYYVYSFAADLADVEVDLGTGDIRVTSFTAIHDSGRIINPLTADSQVEGGIAQGIGLAIGEDFIMNEGHVVTRDLSTYTIPTSLDTCDDVRVGYVEALSGDGPFGAKGLGEPAIIAVPAAVANAVSNAVGVRVLRLPIRKGWIVDAAEDRRAR
jgi:CO/xanthine dehydrogenase Mo-binding subunit